jgi:hypothetical protein
MHGFARWIGAFCSSVVATAPQLSAQLAQPGDDARSERRVEVVPHLDGPDASAAAPEASFLSRSPLLFAPLLADPRWPHFSAAYQSWHASEFEQVGSVSFGESFTLYRTALGEQAQIDFGVQAAVFAIFDLAQPSFDLVNADYQVAPVIAVRSGPLAALLRLEHQSSHLGDEYLLGSDIDRINLSFETIDLLLSVQANEALRLYGGGGYVAHSDTPLDRWVTQAGAEWLGSMRFGAAQPLVAVDVQSKEYTGWTVDLSVRAGLK